MGCFPSILYHPKGGTDEIETLGPWGESDGAPSRIKGKLFSPALEGKVKGFTSAR